MAWRSSADVAGCGPWSGCPARKSVMFIELARAAWIVCAGLTLITLYHLCTRREWPDLFAVVWFLVLSTAAGCSAAWLSFGRMEWRLEQGRLLLQRRFRQNRTTRFEASLLELVEDDSSADGPTYSL